MNSLPLPPFSPPALKAQLHSTGCLKGRKEHWQERGEEEAERREGRGEDTYLPSPSPPSSLNGGTQRMSALKEEDLRKGKTSRKGTPKHLWTLYHYHVHSYAVQFDTTALCSV